jgi:hypothetical protein
MLKTSIPWNDLLREYGDGITAWRRLKEWGERLLKENHGHPRS